MQARTGIVVSVLAATLAVMGSVVWLEFGATPVEQAATQPVVRQVGGIGDKWLDYDPAGLQRDLSTRKTVLVAVHAAWCTDCAAQAPIMARLMFDPEFKDTIGYVVDFDHER